jgi:hypothetical protein
MVLIDEKKSVSKNLVELSLKNTKLKTPELDQAVAL